MPLLGGFRVGRLLGFEIRIDVSWFFVFALVVWTFSVYEFPRQLPGYAESVYYTMGVTGALAFFVSVLLHELAHSVVARARGIEVEGITLFIFGGVAQTRMEARRASDEFLLTIVGPLSSLALAAGFYGLAALAESLGWPAPFTTVASFLALLNFILAVFNMIPGFPLDGGRIFRSIVWATTGDLEKATRWATWGGRLFGYLLMAFGAVQLFYGLVLGGLWSAFIGWFLSNAASTSYRQFHVRETLSKISAARLLGPDSLSVRPEWTVRDLVDRFFIRQAASVYPVVSNGTLLGVVSVSDVAAVPPLRRDVTTVGAVMRPATGVPVVEGRETLDDVVGRLGREDDYALVVQNGRVLGVISVSDIGSWVKRVEDLGL